MSKHRYESPSGAVIVLDVPWGDGSNFIPPPTITFRQPGHMVGGTEQRRLTHQFTYVGVTGE